MGIELRHLGNREELAGMIVAGVVAMFRKSSQDRSSGAAEYLAQLL